jgi:general secretion pathway protein L
MARLWIDVDGGAAWLQREDALASWRPGDVLPPDTRTSVLVRAESVALHRVELPARRAAELRQAVPFALEDRLAEPVESLHFAIGARDGVSVEVAVVAVATMQAWRGQAEAFGVAADSMVADAHLLPRTVDAIHVARIDDRMLLAFGDAAHALPADDWPQWRSFLPPLPVFALQRDGRFAPLDAAPPPLSLHELLRFAAAHPSTAPELMQGAFAPAARRAGQRRAWRLAAVLAGVAIALSLAEAAVGVLVQQQRRDALRAEQAAVFRQALPDARMTADPAAQLAAELGRGTAAFAGDAVALLLRVAPVLTQGSRYRLEAVDYRLQTLEIEVAASDVASLDGLREALASQGLRVEMTGVTPDDEGVRGRLRVQERAA